MNPIIQRLKSKTYWAGAIMAALTILEANQQIIATLLPEKYQPFTPLVFPLVMLFMRELTTTALDEK